MNKMSYRNTGFTLVELLVGIVIIAILATITVVTYNGIIDRANATAISNSLRSTEKALRLFAVGESWSEWPLEANIAGGAEDIDDIIAYNPGLSSMISSSPVANEGDLMRYDSDDNTQPMPCSSGLSTQGVNIVYDLAEPDAKVMESLDAMIDGSDGAYCGKFRYETTAEDSTPDDMYYNISVDGSI